MKIAEKHECIFYPTKTEKAFKSPTLQIFSSKSHLR